MKIRYKNKVYHVQWPKKFDAIIKRAAKKYIFPPHGTDWQWAEADGELRGLPVYLTLRDISRRNSFLKRSSDPKWRKKKLKQVREYQKTHPAPSRNLIKGELYSQTIPEDLKRKHGWKPRSFWTKEQKQILLILAEKYRKSKVTIDWIKLAEDEKVKKLSFQGSFKLCKYYNSLKRKKKGGKKYIKKHRKDALKYKYEHYKAYRDGQERRRVTKQNAVNEFLLNTLELR